LALRIRDAKVIVSEPAAPVLQLRFLWSAVMSHRFCFFVFLVFPLFLWRATTPKKQKRPQNTALHKRNKSGVKTPHSIKNATSKRAIRSASDKRSRDLPVLTRS
jgi:hypothetical protein